MLFMCHLCGCVLYNPFKSYCVECNKVRRIMLLSDKLKFVDKVESIFLTNETKANKEQTEKREEKEDKKDILKRSYSCDDLKSLEKITL